MSILLNLLSSTSDVPLLLKSDLCRCCHAEGSFKNLGDSYFENSLPEVYSDMLQECYDITLNPGDGFLSEITFKICEECIARLRDANSFKKQVLLCEERFRKLCEKKLLKAVEPIPIVIKTEIIDDDDEPKEDTPVSEDDYFPNDNFFGFGDSDDEEEKVVEVKEEVDTSKGKKKKAKPQPKKAVTKKKAKPNDVKLKVEAETKSEKDEKPKKVTRSPFRLTSLDYAKEGEAYRCLHCKKLLKSDTYRNHIKFQHYKKPRYLCPCCNSEFLTLAPFIKHKLEAHNIDDRYHCNACNAKYTKKENLTIHINAFHMLGQKYKCDKCDFETFSKDSLRIHNYKHRPTKEYHCKFCKKSFLRKSNLVQHEQIHMDDRRKVCNVCGQAFVHKASLNHHMVKNHPEVNF